MAVTSRARVAAACAAGVLLAGCNIPYDVDGVRGADHIYVDTDGRWWVAGASEPFWTQPDDGGWLVPVAGDYDGQGGWEAAGYSMSTGTWHTAGARGSFSFPAPPDTPGDNAWVVPAPADYDGDGTTEPAFFDEATATWHVEGRDPVQFGRPTSDPATPSIHDEVLHDLAAPADYDGDGDADLAVYRPYTGEILVDGATSPIRTGILYGLPASADYHDGPGDEAAVAQVEGAQWWIEGEGRRVPFPGIDDKVPVPADYDADGFDDVAVWSDAGEFLVEGQPAVPAPADWGSLGVARATSEFGMLLMTFAAQECRSVFLAATPCSAEALVVDLLTGAWGIAGDDLDFGGVLPIDFSGPAGAAPVYGDYDGDGRPEPAAVDSSTGVWHTGGERGTFAFAAPADVDADPTTGVLPVPADYDGDGDTDGAWFREADATWHVEGQPVRQHGRTTAETPNFDGRPVHDLAVPGDYDGDGTVDLATYRIDTQELHVEGSAPTATGWPAGTPVVGDFDGDGTDELGLWDQAGGVRNWYRPGQPVDPDPTSGVAFAAEGRLWPIVADHDGDGADDLGLADAEPEMWGDDSYRAWMAEAHEFSIVYESTLLQIPATAPPTMFTATAFVDAYVAHCVEGTPLPGECT